MLCVLGTLPLVLSCRMASVKFQSQNDEYLAAPLACLLVQTENLMVILKQAAAAFLDFPGLHPLRRPWTGSDSAPCSDVPVPFPFLVRLLRILPLEALHLERLAPPY